MEKKFNSTQINFESISCADAKDLFVNDKWSTFEEAQKLDIIIKHCNIQTHNIKNPDNPKKIITYIDVKDNEQRIFFNVITLKDATNIASYTKAFLSVITADAFLDDPITNVISNTIGNYTIDAWLEGAVNNDPMLILFPMTLPAKKFMDDVFTEINKSINVTKFSTQVYNLSKEVIDEYVAKPENLIVPFAQDQLEIIEKSLKYSSKVLNEAGQFVEENFEKVIPFSPISFGQIDDIIKHPENIPQEVLNTVTKPVETVVTVVKSVTRKLGLPW